MAFCMRARGQVSFTLRETLARMLKFVMQLQQQGGLNGGGRHPLPTSRLVLRHAFESLVFVPIMVPPPTNPKP